MPVESRGSGIRTPSGSSQSRFRTPREVRETSVQTPLNSILIPTTRPYLRENSYLVEDQYLRCRGSSPMTLRTLMSPPMLMTPLAPTPHRGQATPNGSPKLKKKTFRCHLRHPPFTNYYHQPIGSSRMWLFH